MASPSQSSPLTNSNSNSVGLGSASTTAGGSSGGAQNASSASASTNGTASSSGSAAGKSGAGAENQPILTKPRLLELVREVDVTAQLDEDVEELLLQIADDFVEDAVKATCAFAKHRKVSKVEVRDVQLHLERKWNMWIPGFGTDELRPYKRAAITEAHKQRLALIRKTIKKY
ncbi:PREDICTED: transcription initiation factor TFIID subunit 12 [Rhagoletis zephyria]|uniref:transcription initiation factor TFIID subunit 12 n=1 Tax=Rhagoletis zephyria TaxID=28612 RepID=UPI0008118A62|nr:PREDICTED: transcription initiation factor TFIID subunit 12 [Rhagoletis zephyria]XP_017480050.1 PREDICTED: transcription initiation factor TFIID subunit 12 [Rhagoletis zephyria]XP_017480051.1 PREDICTED: transcription initiation factor TFIID subunit 12 [Rhagoletis zephyria]